MILCQDDNSAISLEKKVKLSSSKQTKHINNQCFFVTNHQTNGKLKIVHCPTNDMVADFHAKPLHGQKFVRFRNMIMNFDDDLKDKFGHLQQ